MNGHLLKSLDNPLLQKRGWRSAQLSDVTESLDSMRVPVESSIRGTRQGKYPYYGASGIIDYVDEYIFDEQTLLVGEDGANLLARSTPIAFIVTGKYWVNNHAHVLRVTKEANISFLCYALNALNLEPYVTGTAQPKLTASKLNEIRIALPPLPEQQRIAAQLDKADRLRRLRRYALDLGETYLQSVFLEMFGDPVRNPKHLPLAMFDEVCDTRLGKMLDEKKQTGKNKRLYLRNINVQWGRFDLADVQEMDFDEREREILRLRKGDVLICEGGEVGRAAIWNDELPECYYQKALHRARPDPKQAIPEFILWLMWCLAKTGGLGDFTSQVTIAHLTGEKLKTIEFPLPPLALQEKFAGVVRQYDRLRAQQRESLRQAEMLFGAMLEGAFNPDPKGF